MQTKIDTMDAVLNLLKQYRAWLDPKLIADQFSDWLLYLAIGGFLMGLITAFCIWYRSARRIAALQASKAKLTKGDIDIEVDTTDIDTSVEEPVGKTPENKEVSKPPSVAPTVTHLADKPADIRISTAYDAEPADADDLTMLEGIDENRAAELRKAGIYNFSQLGDLDEEERRKFGFKFGWKDINWGAWGATATAAVAGIGGAAVLRKTDEDSKKEEIDTVTSVQNREASLVKPALESEIVEEPVIQLGTVPVTLPKESIDTDVSEEPAVPETAIQLNSVVAEEDVAAAVEPDFRLSTVYPEAPEDADNLTEIEGIDAAKAAELRAAGIYKFSQLEELDEDQRGHFSRKFNFPDINWGALGGLGALGAGALLLDGQNEKTEEESAGSDLPVQLNSVVDSTEVAAVSEPDFQLTTVYPEAPDDADDLTEIEGIDAAKAAELRAAGIYKFSQLEELDEKQRGLFSRKFNFSDINWGALSGLGAIGTGAIGANLLAEDHSTEEKPSLAPEDPAVTIEDDLEINVVGDLETGEADEIAELVDEENDKDEAGTIGLLAGSKTESEGDSAPIVTSSEALEDADDFTLLEGIDEEKANALHAAGIHKFSQLEDLDEEDREEFGKKFDWPNLDWAKWGVIGAAGTAAGASAALLSQNDETDDMLSTETKKVRLPSAVADRDDVKADWTWGYTFKERPEDADDLTQLEGISEEDAARLNAEGVYTIRQLEELSPEKREEVQNKFGWGDIDWGKWGAAAVAGTAVAAGAEALTGTDDAVEPGIPAEVSHRDDVESCWTWGYKFKEAPEDADDLTRMDGVTADNAAELNNEGVYTFRQLENLPEDKQEEVKSRFGWGDIDWNKWGTVGTVGTAAAATAAVATMGQDDGGDEAAVWEAESTKLVAQQPSVPSIDTTEKYGELALSKEDFSSQIEEDFGGETIDVHPRYGIIYPAQPKQVDDLTKVRGIGLATEKQLNKFGIYRFKQIENWNAGAVEGISTDLDLGTRIRDDEWISQARTLAQDEVTEVHPEDDTDYNSLISSKYSGQNVEYKPGLGILYHEAPKDPDDLTEINGIGKSIEEKLKECGVYKFTQLADWSDANITAFNDRLSVSGRIERDEWVPQARVFAERATDAASAPNPAKSALPEVASYDDILAEFSGENVKVNPKLGVVYNERPEQADDLKQISGIGSVIEKHLNHHGIYRFSQIANWNDYNVQQFDERLAFHGRIQNDEWISQARSLAGKNDALQGKYGAILSSHFAGEAVTAEPRYGVVYTQQPSDPDDLTEINGIGPITEKQLNDDGIYTFKQIAHWDPETVAAVEEDIYGPGRISRDKWIEQAREFIAVVPGEVVETEPGKPENMSYLDALDSFDGENVDINDNFGVIYTGRPTAQDDLKRIRGVGKFLEGELNTRGVYRFKQIAGWNPYNVWAFGKDLGFPGRITREKWVDQARELAELEVHRFEAEKLAKSEYAGQGVKVDPELGLLYTRPPEEKDDLTQLEGIDEETAANLNSEGIYTIDQVKNLKGPQQKSFASRFGLEEIDWGKWSGLTAIGAVGAAGASVIAKAKEVGTELVEAVSDTVHDPNDLHLDKPKGIFGIPAGTQTSNGGAARQRVVFIMDVSRSLTPAQLRLSKTELSYSVKGLPEGSLYQVIFFSGPTWFAHQRMTEGGARGEDVVISDGGEKINWRSGFGGFEYENGNEDLPGGEWREASPENIAATLEDIEAVGKSYGTTWHLPLTMALKLEPAPEKIFFLTDGETARQDQVAEEMIDLAKQRGGITKINTIALMVPGASIPLHRIAAGTDGEYSLVIAGGKVLKDDDLREYLAEKDIALDD